MSEMTGNKRLNAMLEKIRAKRAEGQNAQQEVSQKEFSEAIQKIRESLRKAHESQHKLAEKCE